MSDNNSDERGDEDDNDYAEEVGRVSTMLVDFDSNSHHSTVSAHLADILREYGELKARWQTFREAVLETDKAFRGIASLVDELGEPEAASVLRQAALVLFTSVQEPAAAVSPVEREPT